MRDFMDKAVLLLLALPLWQFLAIFEGFSGGVLSLIQAIGTVALVAGGVRAVAERQPALDLPCPTR